MNKKIIVATLAGAIVGETLGVIRANHHADKQINALRRENVIVKLQNQALAWLCNNADLSHDEFQTGVDERIAFINIINQQ